MRAISLLVKRNLRRGWVEYLTLGLLIVIAAGLLNLAFLAAVRFPAFFDHKSAELQSPDLHIDVRNERFADNLVAAFQADKRVSSVVKDNAKSELVDLEKPGATIASTLYYVDLDNMSQVDKPRVIEKLDRKVDDPIYLPISVGGYQLGDKVVVNTTAAVTPNGKPQSIKREFHIQGFTETIFLFGPGAGGIVIGMSEGSYNSFITANEDLTQNFLIKVSLHDPQVLAAVEQQARAQAIKTTASTTPAAYTSISYPILRGATMMTPTIFTSFLGLFALVIAAAVVIICISAIRNVVLRDMSAIGSLSAAGFTSAQIIWSLVFAHLVTTIVSAGVGVVASYCALPTIAEAMTYQAAVRWQPSFDAMGAVLAVATMMIVVTVTGVLAAMKIRKIPAAVALSGGLATRSNRYNPFPLAKTPGSLHLILAAKQPLLRWGQSVGIGLIVAMVTFVGVFAINMYHNIIRDPSSFGRLLSGDLEDITIQLRKTPDEAMLHDLREQPEVSGVVLMSSRVGTLAGQRIMLRSAADYRSLTRAVVLQGQQPTAPDQIALSALVAQEQHRKIGDKVTISAEGKQADYLITGIVQSPSMMGMNANLTTDGLKRIDPEPSIRMAVFTQDRTDIAPVMRHVESHWQDRIYRTTDNAKSLDTELGGYVRICRILTLMIVILAACVIGLVMGLVIRTLINQTRQELGVKKAVGFTSGQLIGQTVGAYVPVVLLGAAIGATIGKLWCNRLISFGMQRAGISQVNFVIPIPALFTMCGAILGLSATVTWLASLRIKKISAYNLISE